MSRGRWIWDKELRKLVPAEEYEARRAEQRGPMIITDIEPYRSVATGEVVSGRRQHRDMLRAHGLVEVGNERFPPRRSLEMPPAGADIKRALEKHGRG